MWEKILPESIEICEKKQMDGFGQRVRKYLFGAGFTEASAATKIGVSKRTLNNYLNDVSEPNLERLSILSQITGATTDQLLGIDLEAETSGISIRFDDGQFVKLDRYDTLLSEGSGSFKDRAPIVGQMGFSLSWLNGQAIKPENAFLSTVFDEHMRPSLEPNDVVLIDQSKTVSDKPQIFAFVMSGQLYIRRLVLSKDEKNILVTGDSPRLTTEIYPSKDTEDFKVVGKVAWSAHLWSDT